MKKTLVIAMGMALTGLAFAKLPPVSEEAKVKAAESKAKAAWGDKVAAYKLCLVQDKVASGYLAKGGNSAKVTATPACQDPGPYVAAAAPVPAQAASSVPGSQTVKK